MATAPLRILGAAFFHAGGHNQGACALLKQSGSSQIPQRAVSTASCFRASHTGDIQEGHSGQREYSSAEPTLIADSCVDSGRCTSQYPARSRSRQHVDATWPPLRHWHVGQQSGKEQHSNLCTTSHGPLIHKGRQHEQTAGTSHTMSCSPRVTSTSARAHELHTEHARVHWQPLPSLHGSFRHLSQQGHGYLDLPSQHISIQQPHLSQHRHYASYMPVKRQFKLPAHIEPLVRLKLEGAPKPPAPTIPPLEPRPMLATSRRTGVIAVKAGMTQEWDEYGARVPLTVLWVDDCQVVNVRTPEQNGYSAMQMGAGYKRQKCISRAEAGYYLSQRVPFKQRLVEFKVSPDALLPIGTHVGAAHWPAGSRVDVTGWTKDKGFQGVMKRWGFKGMPASHGTSLAHRKPGATGNRQDPGKIWKGKKLPGHMGDERRTVHNCLIYKVDPARNLLYVRGQVPGPAGRSVYIKDSVRASHELRVNWGLPFPTHLGADAAHLPASVYRNPLDPYTPYRKETDYFPITWKKSD